jgi:RimJ/RimL family protein N-acetyltransferase
MSTIKQLETNRLFLKGVTPKDIPSYQKHISDYEIIRHLDSAVPWPYPKDGAKYYLETNIFPKQGKDLWMWGLFLKTNPDELIGAVELVREASPSNRGFWLSRQHQGIFLLFI